MTVRALLLLICLCCTTAIAAEQERLVVFDAGEGQSLMLQHGQAALLIDTGHAGRAPRILARMRAHGVTQLDRLILTHLHPDHASGFFRIREAFPDTPVLYNQQPLPRDVTPDMVRWVDEALASDPRSGRLAAGDQLQWHDTVIDVLWPKTFEDDNLNRHSLVLSIRCGGTEILVMGDADTTVERELLNQGLVHESDVLIVGHHGAADATSADFLKAVRPHLSILSVNGDNIRGYPDATVMARLQGLNTKVLRTDIDGEICLTLSGLPGPQAHCPNQIGVQKP
jgi:competence protein ComEC